MDLNIQFTLSNLSINVKDLFSLINDGINSEKDDYFVSRLLAINDCSLGIKYSEQPFNVNKNVTEKFIKQMFNLNQKVDNLLAEGKKELNSKILHVFVESAKDLNEHKNSCNPYFKIYLRSFCKNDRLIPISKPFVSKHEKSTTNPKWKTKLDLLIPETNGSESYTKVYKQEICVEVWNKNLKISKLKDFIKRIFCVELDQYIGSAYVYVGKRSASEKFFRNSIPSTPLNLVLPLSEDSVGNIAIKIVWGRLTTDDYDNKPYIRYHTMLYKLCFEWHIIQFQSLENRQLLNNLHNNKHLTYFNFLYMPAISLINQHKIQSNLTSYEDSFLRRYVLAHLIIKLSTEINDFSFILAKVLANEDIVIDSNTSWLSDQYIEALNEVEKDFVIKIYENYIYKIGSLVTIEMIQKSKSVKELLFILRLLRKYHRKYRELRLKEKVNNKIRTEIVKCLRTNASKSKSWPQIIELMDILSEMLREYWYDCIDKIIGANGLKLITNELEKNLKLLINEWKNNENTITSDKILNYFFFMKQLNDYFSGESLSQISLTETESIEEIKPKNVKSIRMKIKTEDYRKQIPLTDTKDSKSSQLNLKDLKFSELIRGKNNAIKFESDFGDELYNSWIKDRINECIEFANNLVRKSLEKINENSLREEISSKFFFKVVLQLIYFPLALNHWWNYNRFKNNLKHLCELCFQICDSLCTYCSRELLDSNIKAEKGALLILLGYNTLFVMHNTHLKRDLIELLTNTKADHILKALTSQNKHNLPDQTSVQFNDFNNANKVLFCCQYIVDVANEIQELQNKLINALTQYIVRQLYRDISEVIKIFPKTREVKAKYQSIDDSLNKVLKTFENNVTSKQTFYNLIINIKTNGENIFSDQVELIFDLFNEINTENKDKLILLFTVLAKMYQKFYDQIMSFVPEKDRQNSKLFENYIETERFTSMRKVMVQIRRRT